MTPTEHPRVTFHITEEDVFRFLYYRSHRGPGRGAAVVYSAIGGGVIASLSRRAPFTMGALAGVCAVAVFVALHSCLLRWYSSRWVRQNPQATKTVTLELSPEGVLRSTEEGEERLSWVAFHSVVGTPKYILLHQTPRSAVVVPRKAFDTPGAASAFLQAAQAWHAGEAVGPPAPSPTGAPLGKLQQALLESIVALLCIVVFPILGVVLVFAPILAVEVAFALLGRPQFDLPRGVIAPLVLGGALVGWISGIVVSFRIVVSLGRHRDER